MNATLEIPASIADDLARIEVLISTADRLAARVEVPPERARPESGNSLLEGPRLRRSPADSSCLKMLLRSRSVTSGGLWRAFFDAETLETLLAIQRELVGLQSKTLNRRSDLDAMRYHDEHVKPKLALGATGLPTLDGLKSEYRQTDSAAVLLGTRLQRNVARLAGPGILGLLAKAESFLPEIRAGEKAFCEPLFENWVCHEPSEQIALSIRGVRDGVESKMRNSIPDFPHSLLSIVIDKQELEALL